MRTRFLLGPPGPKLQKLNALLHKEPYATIAYGIYWSSVLFCGAPLAGIVILLRLAYEILRQFVWVRRRIEPKSDSRELAVVVTGCDSGFGKELVFRLASEGFVVFAGCLKEESFKQFAQEPMIKPLVLDVTSDDHVHDSFKVVQTWLGSSGDPKKNRYLHALVNNAGVGKAGFIDWVKLSAFQMCMEVNCYGQIRMVKAFLPIFKQQAIGRTYADSQIVNVVSMAGMVVSGVFGATPYEVSKYAAEAFTDGLRMEMKMFGVKVVAVNPSIHATHLAQSVPEKFQKELWDPLCPGLKKEYGKDFFDNVLTLAETMMTLAQWDIQVVINSMTDAILSSDPPAKLIIGSDAKFGLLCLRMMPPWTRFMPLQSPACMLSKEELKSK